MIQFVLGNERMDMARSRKTKLDLITIIIFILGLALFFFSTKYPTSFKEFGYNNSPQPTHLKEADYVNMYCKGIIEYKLPDKTRVDCLTDEYAIEFDWAKKWAESVGQSLYYAKMTGKKPAVAIIIKNPTERAYIERIKRIDKDIKIFEIKTEDYIE